MSTATESWRSRNAELLRDVLSQIRTMLDQTGGFTNANRIISIIDDALAENDPDDYCQACGRESLACSMDPCPAVIADREDTL